MLVIAKRNPDMTIKEARVKADKGDVEAMLCMAEFYAQDVEIGHAGTAEKLKSALKWYEKAAQTGNAYAMKMTSATYAIFAETLMQIEEYEDSLENWTQVYRYAVPLIQYPEYAMEERQEMLSRTMNSLYKIAYCNVMLHKLEDALGILEKTNPEPCSREMMLKGICLFDTAETLKDYKAAYEALKGFEIPSAVSCLENAGDDVEELILVKGYAYLSTYYRIGIANVPHNLEKAHHILYMALNKVKGEKAANFIRKELSHYKRNLQESYQYVE